MKSESLQWRSFTLTQSPKQFTQWFEKPLGRSRKANGSWNFLPVSRPSVYFHIVINIDYLDNWAKINKYWISDDEGLRKMCGVRLLFVVLWHTTIASKKRCNKKANTSQSKWFFSSFSRPTKFNFMMFVLWFSPCSFPYPPLTF